MKRTFGSSAWLALLLALLAAGCGEQEQIHTYTVKKPVDWQPRLAIQEPRAAESKAAEPRDTEQDAEPHGKLVYDTPAGWRPAEKVMFAEVSLAVADGGETAKITVSPMGAAQAAVVPNVNRWRGQLGLPPASREEIESSLEELEVGSATAECFEIVGPEKNDRSETILAAMLPQGDRVLIVKLSAESKLAEREKENFLKFLRSLKNEKPG